MRKAGEADHPRVAGLSAMHPEDAALKLGVIAGTERLPDAGARNDRASSQLRLQEYTPLRPVGQWRGCRTGIPYGKYRGCLTRLPHDDLVREEP